MFIKGLDEGNILEIIGAELAQRGCDQQAVFFNAFAGELLSDGHFRAEKQIVAIFERISEDAKKLLSGQIV